MVGDAVFAAGTACLSEAGIQVEALKIECVMTSAFGWDELSGWKSLNLTSMRSLTFQALHRGNERTLRRILREL